MEKESEIKSCQNCKNYFTIESDDFSFYEKIKVPPPTFCPECRFTRRLLWRNERTLYKRTCDATGKSILSMFKPDAFVVYEREYWWSDSWNPLDYGKDYNFTVSFFDQFKSLLAVVPLANLGNTNVINSPYVNHVADSKDCYLVFGAWKNLRVSYSRGCLNTSDSLDLYLSRDLESCYDDAICFKSYKLFSSFNSDECVNSSFVWHSKNISDSIGCVNLRNKNNCILNTEYSKKDFTKKKNDLDLGSYKNYIEFSKIFEKFRLKFPYKYSNTLLSVNTTGDNITHSKNVKHGFDIFGGVEDSKYITHGVDLKEGYDGYGFGGGATLMYEGVDSGIKASNQYFAVLTHSCFNTDYTYMCYNSSNLFGCIGLRNKQYCIFNKQYTKEEYFEMVEKIKKHMDEMPYIDKKGNIYKYGEFFPTDLSPFAYNETIAQEYLPKNKQEIIDDGFIYKDPDFKDYNPTINSEDLPDHINNIDDSILGEIITCPNKGEQHTQCISAFKILESELSFLKQNQIPLPRYCFNCRHYQRLARRNPYKLWHRKCMREGCDNEFETSYNPERPEIVYCERCYQQEVY